MSEWYEVEVQNRGTGEWVGMIARDGKQMPLSEARRLSDFSGVGHPLEERAARRRGQGAQVAKPEPRAAEERGERRHDGERGARREAQDAT